MADSVGEIGLDLVVNQNGFNKQMQGITGMAKKAGLVLAAAFSVKKLVDFSAQCIELGSDLNEVQNVVDVTFTSMSAKVNEFARNAATSFGLSETMAKRFTGTFGAMAKAFGFSEGAAYDMSTALTGLAGDVASFYNISQDEAYTKLKSVFTGETESLKDLGVVMTQAALDHYALANGYSKTTAKMSESEKVMLRYKFVMDQLSLAQGDFARTSDSWANQVRLMKLQFDSFRATIGQGLINLFTPIINQINQFMAKLQSAADAFKSFTELITGKKAQSSSSGAAAVATDADAATDSLNGTTEAAKKAAKAANSLSIDEMNVITPDDSSSSSSSGTSAADTSSAVPADETTEENKQLVTMAANLEKIKQLCKDIGESFKTGFLASTANADFSGITTGLGTIKTALQDIFTNTDLGAAATSFIMSFANAVGANAGAVVTIGTNIASNIVNGIGNYLGSNGQFIIDKLISIFNSGTQVNNVIANISTMLAEISSILTGPDAVSITTNLAAILSNGFLTAIDIGAKFGADLISAIAEPILNNKDSIKTAIEGTLAPIATVVESIKTTCDTAFSHIYTTYGTYIKPAIDAFSSGFNTIFSATLDAYNTYLAPTLQTMSDAFAGLMNDHITPLITTFEDFSGAVVLAISKIWDETLAPFVAWVIESLAPPFSDAIGQITQLFTDVAGAIADTLADALVHLGDFATWMSDNQGTIVTVTGVIAGFFAAWEVIKLMSFIQQSGGVVAALGSLLAPFAAATTAVITNTGAFVSNTAAKIADKAETVILTAMYAKDFVVSLAAGTAALVTQAAQWVASTAVKIADTVATVASTAATTAATVATWAFNAALAVLTSPITLVVAAIAALIAIGILLYKNWDTISAKATEIFGYIKKWIVEKFQQISDFITEVWDAIKAYFEVRLELIKEVFTAVFTAIGSFLAGIWDGIKSKISEIWDSIKSALDQKLDAISEKFSGIFTGIKTTVSKLFGDLWSDLKGIINAILGGVETMANGVVNAVNTVIRALNNMSIDVPDWVTEKFGIKDFGFNIPTLSTVSIPKLATGGYVKANTPQLAMIGDNLHQGEVVAPEDKLLEMAMKAAELSKGSDQDSTYMPIIIELLKKIIDILEALDLNLELDGKSVLKGLKETRKRLGYSF